MDATVWRKRAAVYRSLAGMTHAPLGREVWLRLADICDELAGELECCALMAEDTPLLH